MVDNTLETEAQREKESGGPSPKRVKLSIEGVANDAVANIKSKDKARFAKSLRKNRETE